MNKNAKPRLALIGVDTLRGREIKNVLSQKNFPLDSIVFLDPDLEEEYSKLTRFGEEPKVVQALTEDSLDDMDLVFLAGDREVNLRYGRLASQRKFIAIDLSGAFAQEKDVPAIVPGINDARVLSPEPHLVANPHPAAIVLSHLFHTLRRQVPLKKAVIFVLQPASAFDESGMEELANQSIDMLRSASVSKSVFKAQVAFNFLSQVTSIDKEGFSPEERRIHKEVREVLEDSAFPLSLSLVQAPVFHTYSLMAHLELGKNVDFSAMEELFRKSSVFKYSRPSMSCPVSSLAAADTTR